MPALAVRASLGTAAEGAVSRGSPCSRFLVFMLLCFNFTSEFAIQDLRLCSFKTGIAILLQQPVARCLTSLLREDASSTVPAQRLLQSPWAGGALGEGGPGRVSLGADGGCLEEAARGSISVGFSKPFPTIPVGCKLINHGGAVSIPVCSCALWGWRMSHLPVGWTSGNSQGRAIPSWIQAVRRGGPWSKTLLAWLAPAQGLCGAGSSCLAATLSWDVGMQQGRGEQRRVCGGPAGLRAQQVGAQDSKLLRSHRRERAGGKVLLLRVRVRWEHCAEEKDACTLRCSAEGMGTVLPGVPRAGGNAPGQESCLRRRGWLRSEGFALGMGQGGRRGWTLPGPLPIALRVLLGKAGCCWVLRCGASPAAAGARLPCSI